MPQLLVRGKPVTVSADRVKPAYIFNETDFRNTVCNPAVNAISAIAPPTTQLLKLRSNRHVRIPARFNT
jgi:hypothetical protein